EQTARVRAVRGDELAARELDVGEEPFVTTPQPAFEQGCLDAHDRSCTRAERAVPPRAALLWLEWPECDSFDRLRFSSSSPSPFRSRSHKTRPHRRRRFPKESRRISAQHSTRAGELHCVKPSAKDCSSFAAAPKRAPTRASSKTRRSGG